MSIIDKANEYVGHPKKMDESYTTTARREGYAQGYQDAVDKAVEWLKNNWREYVYQDGDGIVHFGHWESDFRKAMQNE